MKIRNMVLCALFAATMALCAWIAIPFGNVVFTMQSFAVFLALLTLGGGRGSAAILVYLCLGAVGLPVFSGFQGGIGAILGITGGYLWGFLISGLSYWLLTGLFGTRFRIPAAILGTVLCYLCGMLHMAFLQYGELSAETLIVAFTQGILPFLLTDAVKLILAFTLAKKLRRFV